MEKKISSPRLSWRQKANIKYADSETADPLALSKIYCVPVETIYKIWRRRNAAEKEFERVTGKRVDYNIDDFLNWRKEHLT